MYFESDAIYSTDALDVSDYQWMFGEIVNKKPVYKDYYWPLVESLDFFAYAPSSCDYVAVDTETNPPTFTATMLPEEAGKGPDLETMKEFMYAYAPGKNKSGGSVELAFQHPFAAIKFKVSQSHRDLTVKTITIGDVNYEGTFDPDPDAPAWTFSKSGAMVMTVNKTIPSEVNFGGELCGPYLVLPQTNSSKQVEIVFQWNGEKDDLWAPVESEEPTYKITGTISNDWVASKVYTYTVDLGNSREEVLFKVYVNDWDHIYDHEFEIE